MSRWLRTVFFVIALLSALPLTTTFLLAAPVKAEKRECVVYVTRTGERFHHGSCRYLRQSKIRISRAQALKAGYTPCKVCGGTCE